MNLREQHHIQCHFERMFEVGVKPWREHGAESALGEFLKLLAARYPKGAAILDIGCGDGWIAIQFAKEGHRAWGIDSSETAIGEAKEAAKRVNVQVDFRVGDALALPYEDQTFDALIDRGLFHHILPENRMLYFENILRVLKPQSLLYLSVFSRKNPAGIGQRFTPKLVGELFGAHLRTAAFEEDPYPTDAPAHLMHFTLERILSD